jgi:hypothetical protein
MSHSHIQQILAVHAMTANTGVDLAVACQAIEYDNVRLDTCDVYRSWKEALSFEIVNEPGDVVLAGYDVFAIQQDGNASPRSALRERACISFHVHCRTCKAVILNGWMNKSYIWVLQDRSIPA